MLSTGMVRKVDNLGRIVLPIELRRTMGIDVDDPLEFFTDENRLVLNKYERGCIFCGQYEPDDLHAYKGHMVCKTCLQEMHEAKNEAEEES